MNERDSSANGQTHRVILAGNNEAACLVLDLLLDALAPTDVLVIAPPGGIHHAWQPSLAVAAGERGVPVIAPADVNDEATIARVREHHAGLLFSVYYTQLFRTPFLEAIDGPVVNFHPSLLPLHRGVAPLVWSIVDGDSETGVTAHLIDAGVDTGEIVLQRSLPIHPHDTGHDLHHKAARLVSAVAAELLREWLATGQLPAGSPQTGATSYHGKRDPQLNHIDFAEPAERIRNIVRALAPPLPGAWFEVGGRRLTVERVSPVATASRSLTPGMVERLPDGDWAIWTGDLLLRIDAFNDGALSRRSPDLMAFAREGDLAA